MITLLLLTAAGLAGWAISRYTHPFRRCRRCAGTGRHHRGRRRAAAPCRRCGGTGHRPRLGARATHRTILAAHAQLTRRRQRDRNRHDTTGGGR